MRTMKFIIVRLQHFFDYNLILSYRWENTAEYTEGIDRPWPILWRINGDEVKAKMLMAGKR